MAETASVKIEGMNCKHCVEHVKNAIESVKGVKKAEVSLEQNEALIYGVFDLEAVREAVDAAGYKLVS
jgi:copper chaperone CopZ